MTSPVSSRVGVGPPRTASDGGEPEEAGSKDGVVLVVDDDVDFAETAQFCLRDEWDVRLAHDGREAIERYGPHVDVVLLDRRMPVMAGDEALERLRDMEGSARIAMMTAVNADWDVVEMDFDMYLTKPLGQSDLREAVEELFSRAQYAREMRALFSLSSKLALLRSRYPEEQLEDDHRYRRLEDEFERLQRETRAEVGSLDDDEFREMLQVVEDAP
jgi:CheY-like chemotaxis protein